MRNLILQFYGTDPLIAWTLTLALCFTIAAFVIVGRAAYRERRQRREDASFRQSMRAMLHTDESIAWPRPAGHKTPWKDRRKSA